MKLFRYFFFRNYQLNIRQRASVPWLRPLALSSLLLSFNTMTVVLVVLELVNVDTFVMYSKAELQIAVICSTFIVFGLFYRSWIKTGRYTTFAHEFGSESERQRRLRSICLFVYGVLSLATPAVTGYWIYLRNGAI